MNRLRTTALFIAFLLMSFSHNVHAQTLQFSDILALYPLDSNSFKAFCTKNNYGEEDNMGNKSVFTITFRPGNGDKRSISQSYTADTNTRTVLNYFLKDKKEYDEMLKEIKDNGFTFKRHQFTTIQNFTIDKAIYENGPNIATLLTETKEDAEEPFSYLLAISKALHPR
jgi:hypothetical protein